MNKKVCICFVLIMVLAGMNMYGQNSAFQTTALRYAGLALQYHDAGDAASAAGYADMALAYDENCSDALYVRGLCAVDLGETRAASGAFFEKALEADTFYACSRDAVRITLATQYADQYRFTDALAVIDETPRLLTADSQYIRGICLYALGKTDDARTLVSSTWRMYPHDYRFPWLFFSSENPEDSGAAALAARLSANLKNWNDRHPQLNLYASAFAPTPDEAVKLLKQYTASVPLKNREPYYAIQGLKAGYLTPAEAVERFQLYTADFMYGEQLEQFAAALLADTQNGRDSAVAGFLTWLSEFSGTMSVSSYSQAGTLVQYKNGRPVMASCDLQRDDVVDWQCAFDYGVPRQFTDCAAGTTVLYARYPYVSSVHTDTADWNILPDTVLWPSVNVEPCPYLQDAGNGPAFYMPVVVYDGALPDESLLRPAAWKVTVQLGISMDHTLEYSLQDGNIISCTALTPDHDLSIIAFENNIPVTRTSDLLCDGFIDSIEYFVPVEGEPDQEQLDLTSRLYGVFTPETTVRLYRMEIQSEQLDIEGFVYDVSEDGTETVRWDVQEDGSFSQKVVRNALQNLLSYTLIDPVQDEEVLITLHDDQSVSIVFNGLVIPVAYDPEIDFYWIDEDDGVEQLRDVAVFLKEEVMKAAAGKPSSQINLQIDGVQYIVSKNSNWYFATRHLYADVSVN